MTDNSVESYFLQLYKKGDDNEIGHTTSYFDANDGNGIITISFIRVNDNHQQKGYGKLLMALSLVYMLIKNDSQIFKITEITLDDCSDLAMTKNSLYFKLGFRIANANNPEVMSVFINKEPITIPHTYPQNSTTPRAKPFLSLDEFIISIIHSRLANDKLNITWDALLSGYTVLCNKNNCTQQIIDYMKTKQFIISKRQCNLKK